MNFLQPNHIPLVVALIGALALWQIHVYIRRKLGRDHDVGFLYFAVAYLMWSCMAVYEINTGLAPSGIASHFFSFANTTVLLLGVSYIKDGIFPWVALIHEKPLTTIGVVAAIFIPLLAISGQDTSLLEQVEVVYSMLVLTLLCLNGASALYRRGLPLLGGLLIITLVVFGSLEYELLLTTLSETYTYTASFAPLRLASRFLLLIPLLALALSWLGEQLSEQVKSGARLVLREGENQHCVLELNCRRPGLLAGQNFRVDMSNNVVLFHNLKAAAQAQVATGYFRTNTFTNWTTNRKQLARLVLTAVGQQLDTKNQSEDELIIAISNYLFSPGNIAGTASLNWPGAVIVIQNE